MTLEAHALAFGYGRKTIGQGVDINLKPGEILALLGPNGSGKTTLLKTMLGLLKPHAGDVRINGRSLITLDARARARLIGYVPQVHVATFPFSVRDIVLMGRTTYQSMFSAPSRHDHDVTDSVIDGIGLRDFANRPYNEISGGERQLTLIARALVQEPDYIILDEPTASLDLSHQGLVMAILKKLAASQKGVLFTTHDPNQAFYTANRAALIRHGELVIAGNIKEVVNSDALSALYGAPVRAIESGNLISFLPIVPTAEETLT